MQIADGLRTAQAMVAMVKVLGFDAGS